MNYPYSMAAANRVLRAAEALTDTLTPVMHLTPAESELVEAVGVYRRAVATEQTVVAKEPGD